MDIAALNRSLGNFGIGLDKLRADEPMLRIMRIMPVISLARPDSSFTAAKWSVVWRLNHLYKYDNIQVIHYGVLRHMLEATAYRQIDPAVPQPPLFDAYARWLSYLERLPKIIDELCAEGVLYKFPR